MLTRGLAALAPEPSLGIVKVLLIQAGFRWHNAFNESTVRKADDLFACARQDGAYYDPIPKGAELTDVTLEFTLAGSPQPHSMKLEPPHGFVLEHPQDAERLTAFLRTRSFLGS